MLNVLLNFYADFIFELLILIINQYFFFLKNNEMFVWKIRNA